MSLNAFINVMLESGDGDDDRSLHCARLNLRYLPFFWDAAEDSLEADRMVDLRLVEEEVWGERSVIQEERRSSVDCNPSASWTSKCRPRYT
jgi:hypothetical protein